MIVLVIRGGNLQESYSVPPPNENFKSDEVWLIDWDNINAGDTAGRIDPTPIDTLPIGYAEQIPGWTNE
jgi:hypothetical protein